MAAIPIDRWMEEQERKRGVSDPREAALLRGREGGPMEEGKKDAPKDETFACIDCAATFATRQGMKTHRTRMHPTTANAGKRQPPAAAPSAPARAPKVGLGLGEELKLLVRIVDDVARLSEASRAWLLARLEDGEVRFP